MRVGRSSSRPTVRLSPGMRSRDLEAQALEHDLPGEAEPVRVEAVREEPDHRVAGTDAAPVDEAPTLHHPQGEPRQVVLAGRVEVGQLRDLPADEGAPRLAAAGGDAADHGLDGARHHPVDPDVVEEDEGLGAVDEEVVDAHRDQVDADGVVAPGQEGNPELRADAVRRRQEHGVLVAARDAEEPREGADVAQDLRAVRRARPRRQAPDGLLAGIDVDAGGAVAEATAAGAARRTARSGGRASLDAEEGELRGVLLAGTRPRRRR